MIRARQPMCTIADNIFEPALAAITKSAVPQCIEGHYLESVHAGGRTSCGIDYTVTAVLTALLVRFLMGRPYSLRGAMDTSESSAHTSSTQWAWASKTVRLSINTLPVNTNASIDSGAPGCNPSTPTGTYLRAA